MTVLYDLALRWEDYVLAFGGQDDRSETLWLAAAAFESKRSMYVLAVGFDPRALVGLQRFLELDHRQRPIIGLVELPPPSTLSGVEVRRSAARNHELLSRLTDTCDVRTVVHKDVYTPTNAGPRVSRQITAADFVRGVGHLIVDISSLPSNLYFPMIAAALQSIDACVEKFPPQLQVVACENPAVDAAIRELEVVDAAVVGGFRGRLAHESETNATSVWAPVIGERSGRSLEAIHAYLLPDDVFPILPFPSRDPRRGDNLLLEHQAELIDTFGVSLGNIIYADERNPFDLYRTLSRLQANLRLSLEHLGPTVLAVSAHSSKALSLGVLLAAYEHGLPIVTAPPRDYELLDVEPDDFAQDHRLTTAWLAGLPCSGGGS